MKALPILVGAVFACCAHITPAAAPECHFECSGGVPIKLVWQTEAGRSYDLFQSQDLKDWTYVPTFPQPGTGGEMEHPFTAGAKGFFRIIAAAPAPEGFALIPAGEFLMGDQSDPLVGDSNESPVHSVYVTAFYLAKYLVTKELWDSVRTWGLANGYTDLPVGNRGYASKGANYPVHSITWYDMVKWCNARSQKENLTPCYTVGGATYKTGRSDEVACNWSASGYRLPTEAEWEKAARGGLTGLNFPWGNTISHSQANYDSDSSYSYDVSPTRGYHPIWSNNDDGDYPYTSPVGSFAPNGYGLYDMAGNVWEWCWDWYGSYSAGSQTDPRGPTSGSSRVVRGGFWYGHASGCRVAYRRSISPGDGYLNNLGFRPARGSVP